MRFPSSTPLISCLVLFFFFFNDTATTEIYTLSLHDALPISLLRWSPRCTHSACAWASLSSGFSWLLLPCYWKDIRDRNIFCWVRPLPVVHAEIGRAHV